MMINFLKELKNLQNPYNEILEKMKIENGNLKYEMKNVKGLLIFFFLSKIKFWIKKSWKSEISRANKVVSRKIFEIIGKSWKNKFTPNMLIFTFEKNVEINLKRSWK